jgi:hypothetical protein
LLPEGTTETVPRQLPDAENHPHKIFLEEFSLERDFTPEESSAPHLQVIVATHEKRVKYEWIPAKLLKQRFGL